MGTEKEKGPVSDMEMYLMPGLSFLYFIILTTYFTNRTYKKKGVRFMNISKFTQKSIQAVNDLEKLAYEYGNQEIEQEHLLMSLLRQEDSLILKLVAKMGIDQNLFLNGVEQALNK